MFRPKLFLLVFCFFFKSVSIGQRWYLPGRKATHLFLAMTVPLALLLQPRGFTISMGIWRQSPNKSAGAMGKKASADERSEAVDKIFICLMVSSYRNSLFSKPCSRYSWPQVINLFFFLIWRQSDRNTSSCPLQGTQTFPLCPHIFALCVSVSVCGFLCSDALLS